MKSGIYSIVNKENLKFYIGSAVNIQRRWREHSSLLRRNIHDNRYLQFAWNKYGEEAFEFVVVQVCGADDLLKCEQSWINWTGCLDKNTGYNILATAGNSIGYRHTLEAREIMRLSQLGKKQSQETKDNRAASLRKSDKWSCPEGCRCRCESCVEKQNLYARNWLRAKRKSVKCQSFAL